MAKSTRSILNVHGTIVDVVGDIALANAMTNIDLAIASKGLKKAISKGMTVVAKEMRDQSPNKSARRSIGKRVRQSRISGNAKTLTATVGVNVGRKGSKRFPHITIPLTSKEKTRRRTLIGGKFQFLERLAAQFGRSDSAEMRRKRSTGRLKKNSWVKRAFNASASRAQHEMKYQLRKFIEIQANIQSTLKTM